MIPCEEDVLKAVGSVLVMLALAAFIVLAVCILFEPFVSPLRDKAVIAWCDYLYGDHSYTVTRDVLYRVRCLPR